MAHSQSIELTEIPPPYYITATIKVLGPQDEFVGSASNGIHSTSYGYWDRAYTFVDYRTDNHQDEMDDEEIFAWNIESSKNQEVDKNAKKRKVLQRKCYMLNWGHIYNE